jgi:hypothetical protein
LLSNFSSNDYFFFKNINFFSKKQSSLLSQKF